MDAIVQGYIVAVAGAPYCCRYWCSYIVVVAGAVAAGRAYGARRVIRAATSRRVSLARHARRHRVRRAPSGVIHRREPAAGTVRTYGVIGGCCTGRKPFPRGTLLHRLERTG